MLWRSLHDDLEKGVDPRYLQSHAWDISVCLAVLFASAHGIMGEDAWVSGVFVVALSATALVAFAEWEEWGLLLLGLWLALSPWLLGYQNVTAMKINVGIGLAVAYLAAIELWVIQYIPPSIQSR